ncbi:hypothetical protein CC86DRAFT_303884, partial [Ophiobolus disseminans]
VVLPTAGGKSLLFTIPAVLDESGVTVVVIPYRALLDNAVSKLTKKGIDCIEWTYAARTTYAKVVFVSADIAGEAAFLQYGRNLMLDDSATYIRAATVRPTICYRVS